MYSYAISLEMTEREKGILCIPQKPRLEVSAPPEFQGHPGIWSPEDLFVSSVVSCLMTTLFYFLRRKKVSPSRYESKAVGKLEKTEKGLMFTSVDVDATLEISGTSGSNKADLADLANLVEKHCLISHSISCPVTYNLRIAES